MSEPLKAEKKNQDKYNPFLDPNATSEDRIAAYQKDFRDILELPNKKELSENDPDKVVRGWRPVPEGMKHVRAFHYYIQRLDGKTSLWNEMIPQLEPDGRKQITGAVFKDDTVVWSDEGIVHQSLVSVANGTENTGIVGTFQSLYEPGQTKPRLTLYCDDPLNGAKFGDYLRRNLDPQTPLSVWFAPRDYQAWKPHEIPMRPS